METIKKGAVVDTPIYSGKENLLNNIPKQLYNTQEI